MEYPTADVDELVPLPIRVTEITMDELGIIRELNRQIFDEKRIINTFEREDLMMLVAWSADEPIGFKVGYRESRFLFYSAKGGVLEAHRGRGVARLLMEEMCDRARSRGYTRFAYDTFPNLHPGMTVLGLRDGFRVVKADYNPVYKDYRLRLEMTL